jgi:hypothetical protein
MLTKLNERKYFLSLLLLAAVAHFHLIDDVSEHPIFYFCKNFFILFFAMRAFLQIKFFLCSLHLAEAYLANKFLAKLALAWADRHLVTYHALYAVIQAVVHARFVTIRALQ